MTISAFSSISDRALPAVSVIIPVYNSAHYLREGLDSVLAQTFTDYEVIVVNDGSSDTDELERVLASHPLQVIYLSQENRGVSAARNAAIRIARGEFYAQLDADDQWTPEYLHVQLSILRDNPDVVLVYPNAMVFSDSSDAELEFMKVSPSEGEVTFESLVSQQCTIMPCVMARMEAIRNAGLFDESYRSCEDFEFWLRILKKGGRIVYNRRILARYRRHEGSLTSDRVWMTKNILAVLRKCEQMGDLTPSERNALTHQIRQHSAALQLFEGKHYLMRGDASGALERFEEANKYFHSPKLTVVIFLLRGSPRLVTRLFGARERFMTKRHKHVLAGIDKPREMV